MRALPIRLAAYLIARLRSSMAAALLRTVIARGLATLGTLALVLLLARLYGAAGVGVFALAQSLLTVVVMLGRHGMDSALMRFVGRDLDSAYIFPYLRRACIKGLILSTLGAICVVLTRGMWANLFNTPALAPVLVGIAIAAPPFTVVIICSGFVRAVKKPATGLLLQDGTLALLAAAVILVLQVAILPQAHLVNIGVAYAVAAWILVLVAMVVCWQWSRDNRISTQHPLGSSEIRSFNRSSSAFFASNMAHLTISVGSIWIAGYFLTSTDVGIFKAVQQVSLMIGTVLTVLNAVLAPRFAALFYGGDQQALGKLARQGAVLGFCLAVTPGLILLLAPAWVLHLVGGAFAIAVIPLYVLTVAQWIRASCGPVDHLLNMTGHEPLVRDVAWVTNLLGVLTILATVIPLGVTGAALGIAVAVVGKSFLYVLFSWRRLGIWVVPLPNFFVKMRKHADRC